MRKMLAVSVAAVLGLGLMPPASADCCGPTPVPPECQGYVDAGLSLSNYLRNERDRLQERVWNQQATIEGMRWTARDQRRQLRHQRAEIRRLRGQLAAAQN